MPKARRPTTRIRTDFVIGALALILLQASSLLPLLAVNTARADTLVTDIQAGTNPLYIGVNPSTNMVYVSNTNSAGTVTVIDGSTNTVAKTIAVGSWPRGVAVNPLTNRVYVGNQMSNSVSVIDGSTNTVVSTISNVGNPFGLAVNAKTNMIYAVDNPSALVVINGATEVIAATVPLPTNEGSFSVAVDPNTNMIYVTSANYYCNPRCGPVGLVDIINGTSNTRVGAMIVSYSGGDIAVNPLTNKIYTTNGGVLSVIDGATNTITGTISAGGGGVAVNPTTNKVYSTDSYGSGTLSVINGSTNAVIATLSGAGSGAYLGVNSNTDTIYTANGTGGTVSVFNGDNRSDPITTTTTSNSSSASSTFTTTTTTSTSSAPSTSTTTIATTTTGSPARSIVLNTVEAASGTVSASPYQITFSSFDVGTGSNRLLVVGVEANNNNAVSVTFGGVLLTQGAQSFVNNDAEFWYLTNPAGTGDVVVTMSGPTSYVIGVYSFSGVDQTSPIPTVASSHASAPSSPTVSIATSHQNSWVIDLPSIFGGVTLGSPSCSQQWNLNVPNAVTGASSSTIAASPASVTCSWIASSVDSWDDVAIEVAPATSP